MYNKFIVDMESRHRYTGLYHMICLVKDRVHQSWREGYGSAAADVDKRQLQGVVVMVVVAVKL